MSRIGKQPIPVPDGVTVKVAGQDVEVSGKLGTLSHRAHPGIAVAYDESAKVITVSRREDVARLRALHGLNRSLLWNMVQGVSEGFSKHLEIVGTGYGADVKGDKLQLRVGYSQPVHVPIPDGLTVQVTQPSNPAKLAVSGADKQAVGQLAAEIRAVRPPEPYKGKGIKYADEVVRRKAGKAFASAE